MQPHTNKPVPSPLSAALEHVFGLPAGGLSDAQRIQHAALAHNHASWNGDESSCGHYTRYLGREDVFLAAIEHSAYTLLLSDVGGMLLDAVLAAVPFRHETFIVEVRAPHRLWFRDEGQLEIATDALLDSTTEPTSPDALREGLDWARWLFGLLPNGRHLRGEPDLLGRPEAALQSKQAQAALRRWRSLGSPGVDDVLRRWHASDGTGSADALSAVWACFFLDEPEALQVLADQLLDHRAAAVRSGTRLALEALRGEAGRFGQLTRASRDALSAIR